LDIGVTIKRRFDKGLEGLQILKRGYSNQEFGGFEAGFGLKGPSKEVGSKFQFIPIYWEGTRAQGFTFFQSFPKEFRNF